MRTEEFQDGTETRTITHAYSDKIVAAAMDELRALFADGKSLKSGDLEDHFTGKWSMFLEHWRATPHFPALARLVEKGEVAWGRSWDGDVYYALPGHLPDSVRDPSVQLATAVIPPLITPKNKA